MDDPSKKFINGLEVPNASKTYNIDITGKSAAHVIAILKSIVNDRDMFRKKKVFTFNIDNEDQQTTAISFNLKAKPFEDQPGNGLIWRKDPRDGSKIKYSYDNVLVDKLKEQYSNDTKKFAQDIKCVFKNNSELLKSGNEIIKDVYFLLLFEIGRRLVKDDESSTRNKKDLDNLRISEAITKIVKLFENEACHFENVFLKEGAYHCFSDDLKTRQDAIRLLLIIQLEDLKELFDVEELVSETSEDFADISLSE